MLKSHQQLLAVVDEFGSLAGVVTMEDIMESILGREILKRMTLLSTCASSHGMRTVRRMIRSPTRNPKYTCHGAFKGLRLSRTSAPSLSDTVHGDFWDSILWSRLYSRIPRGCLAIEPLLQKRAVTLQLGTANGSFCGTHYRSGCWR